MNSFVCFVGAALLVYQSLGSPTPQNENGEGQLGGGPKMTFQSEATFGSYGGANGQGQGEVQIVRTQFDENGQKSVQQERRVIP